MASAMRVFRKFQSSDGRIKAITASGVLALAAVVALAVGVLPAMADGPGPTAAGVEPVQVEWGGGSGACTDDLISDDGTDRGPSAARYELHINNPVAGESITYTGPDPDETQITITVDAEDTFFMFTIEEGSGMGAYDVVVNGGKKSNHYEYDEGPTGIVPSDSHLSAPRKDNRDEVHKLSHINLCYDLQATFFECGADAEPAVQLGDGLVFTVVKARIFANSENTSCVDKLGFFFADGSETSDPDVLLDFGDGTNVVAGRLDITKDFGSTSFVDLQYLHDALSGKVDVSWCNIRDAQLADLIDNDGAESPFHDVLGSDVYPTLDAVDTDGDEVDDVDAVTDAVGVPALACKVHVEETATGIQYNVVYFEFEDPHFF